MNLYHLRYFVKLAYLQHYTKAAAELNITQPSLSHAISQMENELGVSLFERDGRNIVITRHGQIFLAEVEKSLDILDAGINSLRLISSGEGRIDVGHLRTLGVRLVPELVRGFLEAHPGKKIDFRFQTASGLTFDLIDRLKKREYDIVFCSKVEGERDITFLPVGKQELVLIVPLGHPLAERDRIDLVETLAYPQILFAPTSGLRPIVDTLFHKIGRFPEVVFEIEEDQVIAGLVAQNFGIAVVPMMEILQMLPVKQIEITKPSYERLFHIAVVTERYRPPVVKEFLQYAVDHAKL